VADARQIRARIRAREGWQTRRRAALAAAEAQLRRLRRADRRREAQREIVALRRQIREGGRQLAELRRQLAELRRAEPEPSPEPELPPEPPGFEDRILAAEGGVGTLPDGRTHGLLWVPAPDPAEIEVDGPAPAWSRAAEDLVLSLAPYPGGGGATDRDPWWRGRLRVLIRWGGEEGASPAATAGEGYESAGSIPTVAYQPPPDTDPRGARVTHTGWIATPIRLAEIADLVVERLAARGWEVTGILVEQVWGGPGPLPRGEVTG
jgi:hypothetical protein